MKFARIAFLLAGIYGILVIPPMYFMERSLVEQSSLPFNHPEFFYGFVGVTLAWQIAFFIIASDPIRYRPMMFAACVEKVTFGVGTPILYLQHRVPLNMLIAACLDLVLLALFVGALVATARRKPIVQD